MFDLLTPTKPRSTHAPSQSTPYFPHTPSSSIAPNVYSGSHGLLQSLPQPPSLTHPPAFAPQAANPLPPLVAQDLLHTRPTRPSGKLADWFTGESEPIAFNMIPSPTKERLDPVQELNSPFPNRAPAIMENKPAARDTPKPPMISRFSLFGSKSSLPKPMVSSTEIDDEWLRLDVKTALLKTALLPTAPTDPLSPSTFKTLQQNAEGLLTRLQAAYKERSRALHDVLAEKEAQAEELEGAQTRTRHLKMQLDDMTAKLAEQDQAMMDLVDQLAQEKQARREAEDANRRASGAQTSVQEMSWGDTQRSERQWNSRTSTASDMSLESEDSCVNSLFSRRGATSPAMSMSSVSTMNSPESQQGQMPAPADRNRRPAPQMKGTEATSPIATPLDKCAKCSGFKESEAWSLVNILKLENQGLKTRLGQLESTVDDCLDMVRGLC